MKTVRGSITALGLAMLVALAGCAGSTLGGTPGAGGSNATGGSTGIECPPGQTLCGTACFDTATDSNNCGACGLPCAADRICANRQCQCPAPLLDCSGACVASDAAHCGGCTNACTATQVCSNGTCFDESPTGAAGDGGTGGTGGSAGSAGTGGTPPTMALVTSAPGAYWNTSGTLSVVTAGTADVTVNDGTTMQTWEGFGGAFNEMGWNVLSMLSPSDRDKALQLLFGADGARFAFGRIPIGASDYAMSRYTLDEVASGTDTSLASFSIERDKDKLIPFIKAAQKVKGNIRFWASPWTPPTWMKAMPFKTGTQPSPFDGGTMKTDDATLKAFAQYLIKFVQAYAQQSITIEAISPQNEPSFDQNYPSCLWATSNFVAFIGKYLGPAITTAGLSTKIMLGTMSDDWDGKDPAIMTGVMADATAKPYIKALGLQWGMQSQLATARSYNLPLWQTDHKCGNYPWNPSGYPTYKSTAPNDQAYAVESWGLIRDWIKGGVTAYSASNMVLDTVGKGIDTTRDWAQNALLTVNTTLRTLNVTPAYHVFRHISQFVDPGAKVVATSGGDALAFKNPNGSIVTVLYNSGATKNAIVSASGRRYMFSLPGSGWATVVSQ